MGDIRIMVVGSAKAGGRRRPRIRVAGLWLEGVGFPADALVTVGYDKGSITMRSQGKGVEAYSRLVGQIRQGNSGLVQVRSLLHNKKRAPHLEVKGFWLERFGFSIGDVVAIRHEHGLIRVSLLDLSKIEV